MIRPLPWLLGSLLVASLGSVSCKIPVEDNCANQDVPGNVFCRERYANSAPYCSPCRRELNGCVPNPPFGCPGYYDEVDEDDGMNTSSGSGGATGSTGIATGDGSTSG